MNSYERQQRLEYLQAVALDCACNHCEFGRGSDHHCAYGYKPNECRLTASLFELKWVMETLAPTHGGYESLPLTESEPNAYGAGMPDNCIDLRRYNIGERNTIREVQDNGMVRVLS